MVSGTGALPHYRRPLPAITGSSGDRSHMEYDPLVDLPGGDHFHDVTALFEDAAEGDQKCFVFTYLPAHCLRHAPWGSRVD